MGSDGVVECQVALQLVLPFATENGVGPAEPREIKSVFL